MPTRRPITEALSEAKGWPKTWPKARSEGAFSCSTELDFRIPSGGIHRHAEDFRDAEEADQDGDDLHAALEGYEAEIEAHVPANRGDADHADQDADDSGGDALEQGFLGDGGDDGQTEDRGPEVFGGTEFERRPGQGDREEQQSEGAHDAADAGTHRGDVDGFLAAALPGMGYPSKQVPWKTGAWRVQEDRRERAAENGAQ
jgi:hypothetical protein